MFPSAFEAIQNFFVSSQPFRLEKLKGFPIQVYNSQKALYSELRRWYTGEALDETVEVVKNGKKVKVPKFPIKINPLKKTVEKHVAVLMGSTPESIRDGAMPVHFRPDLPAEEKDRAEKIVKALNKAFLSGGAGAMLQQNATISEYLGGSILSSRFRNGEIEVSNPHPSELVAIPDGINYWRLREAWIVRPISPLHLANYGMTTFDFPKESQYFYIEHWTTKKYSISINDKVVLDSDGEPMEGENPYGVVPIEYIPHLRDEDFIGFGDISEDVKGLIREMNLRSADVGDAVSDDSHKIIPFRNVRDTIKVVTIDGRPMLNLGNTSGIVQNESQPDMFAVNVQSASAIAISFIDRLESFYRQATSYPAVADGVDQGSQRSSKTLDARMWPLQSHVDMERVNWSVGLIFFAKIMLKMMAVQGIEDITMEDAEVPIILEWQPQLARDRDSLVNEVVQRSGGDNPTISQRSSIALLGNPNPDEELAQIQAEQKDKTKLAMSLVKQTNQNQDNNFNKQKGSGGDGNQQNQ
jgi:hypothetical protein